MKRTVTMNRNRIEELLKANGIPFLPELPEKLAIYFRLLTEWNEKMDLVAAAPEEELLDRHLADSLTVLKTDLLFRGPGNGLKPETETGEGRIPRTEIAACAGSLIDVGTGAGFPGMALALALPGMNVTLMDSQKKRLLFLEKVIAATGTENVMLVHSRAEDGARRPELRERMNFAVARAVAPLSVLCEYLLPFVKPGGMALCWKGPALAEEAEAGRKAAFLLGGRILPAVSAPVANRDWEHVILPVGKISRTPKIYPRKAGTPKANPLGEP
ncbi:MAG: 16S rRNA (guanine(527)-N(7))-methyltransferase RsmG [Clostridiales bacterium]|nr:16S rRNA (guanine(527)-N(7))-methyltransferase RsmG [Clostridiales bacterium]